MMQHHFSSRKSEEIEENRFLTSIKLLHKVYILTASKLNCFSLWQYEFRPECSFQLNLHIIYINKSCMFKMCFSRKSIRLCYKNWQKIFKKNLNDVHNNSKEIIQIKDEKGMKKTSCQTFVIQDNEWHYKARENN